MADNKFLTRLKGKTTRKSVVQIDNDKLIPVFGNMPTGSNGLENIIDQKDSSSVVAKSAENWCLNGNELQPTNSDTFIAEHSVSGQGLWIDASYTYPLSTNPNNPVMAVITPNAKWVLRFCGDNLLNSTNHKIRLTAIIKTGSTILASKTFMLEEQANFFCKVLEFDREDTPTTSVRISGGAKLTVQLLCADTDASANIYSGKTILSLLQRRIDVDVVASDNIALQEILEGRTIASDFFNDPRFIEQIADGKTGGPIFIRDDDKMNFNGWQEPVTEAIANMSGERNVFEITTEGQTTLNVGKDMTDLIIDLFWNGQLITKENNWSIVGTDIELNFTPEVGDIFVVMLGSIRQTVKLADLNAHNTDPDAHSAEFADKATKVTIRSW